MRIIDRPAGKHTRLAERAALDYGATSVAWRAGGKHHRMIITMPDGSVVTHSVPHQPKPWQADHEADWVRQSIRRAARGQHRNGRKP